MLTLPPSVRLWACTTPADIRKSFDGLGGAVEATMGHDAMSGQVFVFFNKRASQIRLLWWDRDGWMLLAKRLEATAEVLNREGFRAPRGGPVTGNVAHTWLSRQGLTRKNRPADRRANAQQPDEVPLIQAAERIGMPAATLRIWIDNGKAKGRVARDYGAPKVLVRLDDQELQRLQALRRQPARGKRRVRREGNHDDSF